MDSRRWPMVGALGLSLAASSVAARHLRAEVVSAVEDVAMNVEALASASPGAPRRTLSLNGATFDLETGEVEESVTAVVEAEAASCTARTIASRGWAAVGPDPVVRSETETSGIVACLAPDAPWGNAPDLASALGRFATSGDVRDVGRPELVIARRSGARTAVLRLLATSAVRLSDMFPADRDVPGRDPGFVPRPPRARRVLAAEELGAEPAILGYRSEVEPGEVAAAYRDALVARGWALSDPSKDDPASFFAQKGRRSFVIAVSPDAPGSTVALIRLR